MEFGSAKSHVNVEWSRQLPVIPDVEGGDRKFPDQTIQRG